jgi:hypothetical protein
MYVCMYIRKYTCNNSNDTLIHIYTHTPQVHIYNFSAGQKLLELLSEARSEIISLGITTPTLSQKVVSLSESSVSASDSFEAGAYIVAAEESGTLWMWPNRSPKEERKITFVRRLLDCESKKDAQLGAMATAQGVVVTGSINSSFVTWSLNTSKVVRRQSEIQQHETLTGQNTCQSLLLIPRPRQAAGPAMVAAGSEGLIVISNPSDGRVLSQFHARDIEYFKGASVTALCIDAVDRHTCASRAVHRDSKPRLLFAGDDLGAIYCFDISRVLYPEDYCSEPPGGVGHHRQNASVKLFEVQALGTALDTGVTSIVLVSCTSHLATAASAGEADLPAALYVLAVGATDGSVTLWTSDLKPVTRLQITPCFQRPQEQRALGQMLSSALDATCPAAVVTMMSEGKWKWSNDHPKRVLCISLLSAIHLPVEGGRDVEDFGGMNWVHAALFMDAEKVQMIAPVRVSPVEQELGRKGRHAQEEGGGGGSANWEGPAIELKIDDDRNRRFRLEIYSTYASSIHNQTVDAREGSTYGNDDKEGDEESDDDTPGIQDRAGHKRILQKMSSMMAQKNVFGCVAPLNKSAPIDISRLDGKSLGSTHVALYSLPLHSEKISWLELSDDDTSHGHAMPHTDTDGQPRLVEHREKPKVLLKLKITTEEQLKNEANVRSHRHNEAAKVLVRFWRRTRSRRVASSIHDMQQEADETLVLKSMEGGPCEFASKLVLHRILRNRGKWWPPPSPKVRLRWFLENRPPPLAPPLAAAASSYPSKQQLAVEERVVLPRRASAASFCAPQSSADVASAYVSTYSSTASSLSLTSSAQSSVASCSVDSLCVLVPSASSRMASLQPAPGKDKSQMVILLRTHNCETKPAVAGGADALPSAVMAASGSNVSSSSSSIFVSTAPSVGMKGGERGKGRGEGVRKELSRLSLDCVASSLGNSSQSPYSSDLSRAFHAAAQTSRERATPSIHLGNSSQSSYMSASAQTQRATRSIHGQDTCDSACTLAREHANKCICHMHCFPTPLSHPTPPPSPPPPPPFVHASTWQSIYICSEWFACDVCV